MKGQRGFTLLELIVTIGLLVGLSSVIVLNSVGSREQIKLSNSAKILEVALTEAQAYGSSGKAFPEGDTSPEAFDRGYGVYVSKNASEIIIYGGPGDLDGDGTFDPEEGMFDGNEDNVYERIYLEGGVKVVDIDGSNAHAVHILFKRGDSRAHIRKENPEQPDDEVTFRLSLGEDPESEIISVGAAIEVIVNKTGLIYVKD